MSASAKRLPWFKFYAADWRSDERLGICSAAARGVWIECLALMHIGEPSGYLLVNGKPPTLQQLAMLCRLPVDVVEAGLDELEAAGVLSRTKAKVIFSRRMVRDENKRILGANAAKRGGNPPRSPDPEPIDPTDENGAPPGSPSGSPAYTRKKPEARYQRREEEIPHSEHRSRVNAAVVLQGVLDPMNAKRFADHCAGKRRPLSAEQAEAVVIELKAVRDAGGNPVDAVDRAIRRGWTSFERGWLADRPAGGGGHGGARASPGRLDVAGVFDDLAAEMGLSDVRKRGEPAGTLADGDAAIDPRLLGPVRRAD